jgi:hypothetical protein
MEKFCQRRQDSEDCVNGFQIFRDRIAPRHAKARKIPKLLLSLGLRLHDSLTLALEKWAKWDASRLTVGF